MSGLTGALELAARGLAVFPIDHPSLPECVGIGRDHNARTCIDRGKHPAVKWSREASRDAGAITVMFSDQPRNVGVSCGPSGLVVLDEDQADAVAGYAASVGQVVPVTLTVRTGKGRHYYFAQPTGRSLGNSEGRLHGRGINVRGAGGYVVGPGSLHANGALYEVETDAPVIALPAWLVEAITGVVKTTGAPAMAHPFTSPLSPGAHSSDRAFSHAQAHDFIERYALAPLRSAPIGTINIVLNEAATVCAHFGEEFWPLDEVNAWLVEAASLAGYDARTWKAEATIASARSGQGAREWSATLVPDKAPRTVDGPAVAGRTVRATRASQISMEATDWAWHADDAHWLAQVGMTLLGGREGVGKSSVAFWLAAQISRGMLPGDLTGRPRGAVIVAGEDAWAQTVVPRLAAAGADLDRVMRVDAVSADGFDDSLTLPADLPALREVCRTNDVALVVLDPLMSVIPVSLDSHKDQQMRKALEPLAQLGHECRLAIVGLIHVNKSQGNDLLTRLMASRAFAAVARGVLFAAEVVPEVGADDASSHDAYMLGQPKNNLAAKARYALTYRIEGARVGYDPVRDKPIVSSRVVWTGRTDAPIAEVVAEQETRSPARETTGSKCADWLVAHLQEFGPTSSEALKQLAEIKGFSVRTLQRARSASGVVVRSVSGSTATVWALSSHGTHDTHGIDDMDGTDGTDD